MKKSDVLGEQSFSHIIEQKLKEGAFVRFDLFIIRRMGYEMGGGEEDGRQIRKKAYRTFLDRISDRKPASLPTIRRWFGVRDFRPPSREQLFRIAFSLGLGVEETRVYLTEGIREPSFQINDHSEMIAMYCLENGRDYDAYRHMVEEYEANLGRQQEISQGANTKWLFSQFEFVKNYPEEQFMYWMWEHASLFKGYSVTVQQYLTKYREEIIKYMKNDVKKQLELLLSETGYAAWKKRRLRAPEGKEGELIKKYLRWDARSKKREIPEHFSKNILELTRLAYSESGLNTKLMSELFEIQEKQQFFLSDLPEHTVRAVSGKYLSDLFHIPDRNEIRIHTKQAIQELKKRGAEEPCPQYVVNLIRKYEKGDITIRDVGEALEWLEEFDSETRRRRLIVKRDDLLPMVLYVAQHKYMKSIREEGGTYHSETARKMFTDLANATMIACNMAPLDERYIYDMILLACFQEEEMYGYGDVMELA